MAALNGGNSVHIWAGIPVNSTTARGQVQGKAEDGDVGNLFLDVFSSRWLLLDEVSTMSPSLLGLLDAYWRTACFRHLYAK